MTCMLNNFEKILKLLSIVIKILCTYENNRLCTFNLTISVFRI